MNINRLLIVFPTILILAILFTGCPAGSGDGQDVEAKRAGINEVIVHELGDPQSLNPPNSSGASSTYIQQMIFHQLLWTDQTTFELSGWLAISRPEITLIEDGEFAGGMKLVYEIRPEAEWDNGTPITAADYVFTIKAILNPKTDCEPLKPYFDWMGDIVVDESNPRKFTIYATNTYMMVEEFSGYWVLPEYIYDPQQLMRKFTVRDLATAEKRTELKGNEDIILFAEQFNNEKFQREKGSVVGSGAYEFDGWDTGERITLKRKTNWWGDKLAGTPGFSAFPEKIIFRIIKDQNTAFTALKDESLDLQRGIVPKDYIELVDNERFNSLFNLTTPEMFAFGYIGMNTKNPKLADVRVRQAISHTVNKQEIIDILFYGLAVPTIGPVHPSKPEYNTNVTGYDYDLEKAKKLLDEAGWVDSDGNGIRDKMIDGQLVQLVLEYKYNSENDTRKSIGLLFQEEAKKIGIEITIASKEWSVFLEDMDSHEFEMYCGSWVFGPTMSDPKQIWHTNSAVLGGSNYCSFGNAQSDALIDSLRMSYDPEVRNALSKQLQQIINDEAPYVFLYTPTERIAIQKRFECNTYSLRPGYDLGEFKMTTPNLQAKN